MTKVILMMLLSINGFAYNEVDVNENLQGYSSEDFDNEFDRAFTKSSLETEFDTKHRSIEA